MIDKILTFVEINLQLIVLLAFVLVSTFIIVIIILNWRSSENYEVLKPAMGGLLISGFFIITTFFSPIEPIKYKTDIAIMSREESIVGFQQIATAFPDPLNGYSKIAHLVIELNKNKIPTKPIKEHQYLLELIEYASIQWIGENYPNHWQLNRSWIRGMSGGGGGISIKPSAEKDPKIMTLSELLKGNMYSESNVGISQVIALPKGTKSSYKDHTLILDNENIQLKIIFGQTQFLEKLGVDLGQKLNNEYGPDLYAHYFTVEWVINTKRPRRWSSRTKQQIEWAKELAEAYQKAFSFPLLEDALKKRYSLL